MVQFALVSLIPSLLKRLEDAADPEFDSYERTLVMPTSLKTSDRNSCGQPLPDFARMIALLTILVLAYMGLPLQL